MHEQLGLAIGRLCMTSAPLRDAVMRGYTRALHEKVAGRKHTDEDIVEALDETERMFRELHPGARSKRKEPVRTMGHGHARHSKRKSA